MVKFKNWLITVLTRKDKLVCVPESWQTEYVQLAGDKVRNKAVIGTLVTEYNKLLQDYYKACSIKDLLGICKENDIPTKSNVTKQELVDTLYEEFKMSIQKD